MALASSISLPPSGSVEDTLRAMSSSWRCCSGVAFPCMEADSNFIATSPPGSWTWLPSGMVNTMGSDVSFVSKASRRLRKLGIGWLTLFLGRRCILGPFLSQD
jgi:hypothetical protein